MNKIHVMFGLAALLFFSGCLGLEQAVTEEYRGNGYAGGIAASEPAISRPSGSNSPAELAIMPYPAEKYGGEGYYDYDEAYAPAYDSGYANYYGYEEQMIIKTGYVSLKVPEGTLEDKINTAKTYALESGGDITGMNYYESDTSRTYSITVRIRPQSFDAFVDKLKTAGSITSMSTDLDDVAEQYRDLEIRIENLEAELARLNQFYEEADSVEELLMIEREATRVTADLERCQQQRLDLERMVSKSTVTVNIVEEKSAVDTNLIVPLQQLAAIFFGALSASIMALAALSGAALPAMLVLGIVYLVVRALWKKGKK